MPEFRTTSEIQEEEQDYSLVKEKEVPECKYCNSYAEEGCTGNPNTCKAVKLIRNYPVIRISEYIDWEEIIVEKGFVENIDWESVVENYTNDNFGCIGDCSIYEAKQDELSRIVDNPEIKKELNSKIEKMIVKKFEGIDFYVGSIIKEVFENHGIDTNYKIYSFGV
ncbi:hypothetical protein [Methanococcus sp. CF]